MVTLAEKTFVSCKILAKCLVVMRVCLPVKVFLFDQQITFLNGSITGLINSI